MIQAKAEVTLKFNELPTPDKIKVVGQISTFEVTDNALTYRISCRTKSLNKASKAIAGFQHPFVIAATAKKISISSDKKVLLEEVGFQTFERVPKEEKKEEALDECTQSNEAGNEQQIVPLPTNETEVPQTEPEKKITPIVIVKKRKQLLIE